jgi:Na+/melibiose symporter-like transporter
MTLWRKNNPKRRWRSIKRHTALLFKTFCFAAVITYAWYFMWSHGHHFAEDDKDIQIGMTTVIFGVIYGVAISWAFVTRSDKYEKIVNSIFEKNKNVFLRYRDERMLIALHITIGAASVPLIGMIGAVPYQHMMTGAVSVFSVSFVLIMFWSVIALLEDPLKNEWIRERINPEWLTIDIDEYFKFGRDGKE